jgi:importin subunit beta-1
LVNGIADEELQDFTLQALCALARCEYQIIEFYFKEIGQATEKGTSSQSERVGAQAYEFWTSLAEQELERQKKGLPIKNYIMNTKNELLVLIFNGLLKITFDEQEDDDDWGHAHSATCCLQMVSQIIGNDVMPPMINFVSTNIQQPDWRCKYASLMALGSSVEGPEKMQFSKLINDAMINLLAMFKDQSAKVREAISWVMSRICEHHHEVVVNPHVFNNFLRSVLEGVKDVPRVSK